MTDMISRKALQNSIRREPEIIVSGLRYIRADAVRAKISVAPSVDAVPVVRCGECVCCSLWNDQLICSRISDVMDGYYHGTIDVVKPDDYCSHGILSFIEAAKKKEGAHGNA